MSVFTVKAAVVSGLIGLVSVFAAGASAQAAPLATVNTMTSHQNTYAGVPVLQVNHRHGHHSRPHARPGRQVCTPRQAASKASRMGIRNARVSSNRSTLRVSGIRHGRPVAMVFGKARGCPVLR